VQDRAFPPWNWSTALQDEREREHGGDGAWTGAWKGLAPVQLVVD